MLNKLPQNNFKQIKIMNADLPQSARFQQPFLHSECQKVC